jgi:parallel beta-helix repeat protein
MIKKGHISKAVLPVIVVLGILIGAIAIFGLFQLFSGGDLNLAGQAGFTGPGGSSFECNDDVDNDCDGTCDFVGGKDCSITNICARSLARSEGKSFIEGTRGSYYHNGGKDEGCSRLRDNDESDEIDLGTEITDCGETISAAGDYYLSGDLTCDSTHDYGIKIENTGTGSVTLNCYDNSITGYTSIEGIYIAEGEDVLVENCFVESFSHGIYSEVDNVVLDLNTLSYNNYGIYLKDSGIHSILENTLFNNNFEGIYLVGVNESNFSNNMVYDNQRNGISLFGSNYNNFEGGEVYGHDFSETKIGILLDSSNSNNFDSIEVYENGVGVGLISSTLNSFDSNTVNENNNGFKFLDVDYFTLTNNEIMGNIEYGVQIDFSSEISTDANIDSNSICLNEESDFICDTSTLVSYSFSGIGNFLDGYGASCDDALSYSACPSGIDTDGDEIDDNLDNCPSDINPLQEDWDEDGIGDDCDDDADGDGYVGATDDCDESNPDYWEEAIVYTDADGDGYGDLETEETQCIGESPDTGYVIDNTDCNDADSTINPGATEMCSDTIDNDCNGDVDIDDTFCAEDSCTFPYGDIDGSSDIDDYDLDTLLYILRAQIDGCGASGNTVCDYIDDGYYVCQNGYNNYADTSLVAGDLCPEVSCASSYGDIDGDGDIDDDDLDTLLYILRAQIDGCGASGNTVCDYIDDGYYVCQNGENNYMDTSIGSEYICN